MYFCDTRLLAEVKVDPTIRQMIPFQSHEHLVGDSTVCKLLVALLDFPLELQALKYLFPEAVSQCELICTRLEVNNQIRLDKPSISSAAPIEFQALSERVSYA